MQRQKEHFTIKFKLGQNEKRTQRKISIKSPFVSNAAHNKTQKNKTNTTYYE